MRQADSLRTNRITVLGINDCRRLFTRAVEAEGVECAAVNARTA